MAGYDFSDQNLYDRLERALKAKYGDPDQVGFSELGWHESRTIISLTYDFQTTRLVYADARAVQAEMREQAESDADQL
jgi:hypothetical protein